MPAPPQNSPNLDQNDWQLPLPALSDSAISSRQALTPSVTHDPESDAHSFQRRLASARMPEPGPAYFHARRALWWAPGPHSLRLTGESTSRRKLERLLSQKGAEESEEVWNGGLVGVWNGLISGARLKKRLPLGVVVRILMAGWIRDGTWPKGGVAPEPDDELEGVPPETQCLPSTTTPSAMERIGSPWSMEETGATNLPDRPSERNTSMTIMPNVQMGSKQSGVVDPNQYTSAGGDDAPAMTG